MNQRGRERAPKERAYAKNLRSPSRLGLLAFGPDPAAQEGQPGIDELKKSAVKVYLDCGSCDLEFIKTEITFVNYVRDRLEAQVHILVTTQATGGGGREYTLNFMGQNDFKDTNDVQKYFSTKTDTEDDVRRGLVNALKLGLMSFVGRTPIARRIAIDYSRPDQAGRDRWNFWVFSLTGSGYFSGEESYMSRMADASFSANRVTLGSKVRLGVSLDTQKKRYDIDDEVITGTRSSWDGSGLSVFSFLGYSWIRDQLSLLGREPTFEEILFCLRELPMNNNYFISFGFQFTFGSIFTNVINPRFGSSGGGGMNIHIN